MLDRRWRAGVERGLTPVGRSLQRIGITADFLTVVGLAVSLATALLVATGHLVWGVVGIIASGFTDVLDGAVARQGGRASPRGAFFDSVADRASDALVLGGVAWYLADRSPYLPVLALAVAALSMLVSYERAKADALGYDARGGLMERAERMVVLGVGMAFDVLVPVLWLMLVTTAYTVVVRFVKVWRQASVDTPLPTGPRRAARHARRVARAQRSDTEPRRLARWWESRRPERRRRVSSRTRWRSRP
ncbi:MAG: CDP-alcohol phosphatidyltransferase family protein [Acidimicrobiia bacterium]|nr:CDP-alcohol phosphatidyltransferase family protein [Acidimicrobiia bacterium]